MEDGMRPKRISGMTEARSAEPEEEMQQPEIDGEPILYPKLDKTRPLGNVTQAIMLHKPAELQKMLDDALRAGKQAVDIGGNQYSVAYVKYIIEMMKKERNPGSTNLTEIDGTRYFAQIPVGAEFKIPHQPHVFRKIDKDTALLGKKRVKIKNETLVNVHGSVNEMTSSGAVGQPGGMIQTPAWGTKNKLGSPKGIKGSEKLGYKVVRSITN
jgi:hypothetical protein